RRHRWWAVRRGGQRAAARPGEWHGWAKRRLPLLGDKCLPDPELQRDQLLGGRGLQVDGLNRDSTRGPGGFNTWPVLSVYGEPLPETMNGLADRRLHSMSNLGMTATIRVVRRARPAWPSERATVVGLLLAT